MRRSSRISLALVLAGAALVRLRGFWGIVDVDTDAYGHAIVARRLIERPFDLAVHWVWLPLWHCVHALFELIGLGFEGVRALSMLASLATVALVFVCAYRELASPSAASDDGAAVLAATVSASAMAFAPHAVESAVSAEPEAVFALLIFGSMAALRWQRAALSGVLLSLAAMTRYEAWPVIAGVFAYDVLRRARREASVTLAWLLPTLTVLAWCVAHRVHSGEWLWFVRENRAFVARALPRLVPRLPAIERRALWYPATIPWINWGALPLLASFSGMALFARERRWPWLLGPAAIVGFVSFAWVRGQHLGLVRHAVSYLPFYAMAMGAGALWAQKRLRITQSFRWQVVFVCAMAGWFSLRGWRAASAVEERADRRLSADVAAARTLTRSARREDVVYIDSATVEVLSRVRRAQFIRWNVSDVRPANLHAEQARNPVVWVVSRPERTAAIREATEVVFASPTVVVLRALRR